MISKTGIFLFIIILLTASSCAVFGIYGDDSDWAPDNQAKLYAEISNRPVARRMDSLIVQIDAALTAIPSDLDKTTLVVETYDNYSDYLKSSQNKFWTPEDTKKYRRGFKKYQKRKRSLIRDPKYHTVYLDKKDYETMDIEKFRYVLKTTYRLDYDPERIIVYKNGLVAPFIATMVYYLHDRKTHAVFNEIKSLEILEK